MKKVICVSTGHLLGSPVSLEQCLSIPNIQQTLLSGDDGSLIATEAEFSACSGNIYIV